MSRSSIADPKRENIFHQGDRLTIREMISGAVLTRILFRAASGAMVVDTIRRRRMSPQL
jgi:hypothetical protein